MYLSLIGSTWIRSREHANCFGSDPVCTPEKFWIRSKKERSRTDPLSCAQGLGVVLDTVYDVVVHFTIYSTKHNPQKITKYIIKDSVFLLLWGLKMRMKMSFMGLEIWFYIFRKVLE